MIPTEEQYNEALAVIAAYKLNQRKQFDEKVELVKKELDEYFKNTYIKKFRVHTEEGWGGGYRLEITSLKPTFDEDYSGDFDDDMDKIGEKYGIDIHFEPHEYGK